VPANVNDRQVSGISPTLSSQPGMTSANMVVRSLLLGRRLQPDYRQRSRVDQRQHAGMHRLVAFHMGRTGSANPDVL